ncbi:hypothetical protein MHY30_14275, partial [Microbacterium sp. ACRRU]|nr:hypothetical protein [Microbacterium sp. ACRRU]
LLRGVTLPAVRHDLTSLPARTLGRQDDSHNDWTYKTGSVQGALAASFGRFEAEMEVVGPPELTEAFRVQAERFARAV